MVHAGETGRVKRMRGNHAPGPCSALLGPKTHVLGKASPAFHFTSACRAIAKIAARGHCRTVRRVRGLHESTSPEPAVGTACAIWQPAFRPLDQCNHW